MMTPNIKDTLIQEQALALKVHLGNIAINLKRLKTTPLSTSSDPEQKEINASIDNCIETIEQTRTMLQARYGIEG